ncbi:MAG: fatty acid desaturase family protein [Microbacteriaceae bacterium]|nr:fatty acid desaturase family protein [Burkholderiaceae bacterium]
MAAAPRARPDDFFSPDDWRMLSARSSWRGLWLVVHCWGVIGLAMVAGALWPLTIPLGVLVVGARQLGLFILMHDAAHGLLHPNRRVNDRLAQWFCSSSLHDYRPYHLQHHRYVQQAEDPDLPLSAPFPISRVSLRRKLLRDLSGQTFFKQRLIPLWNSVRARRAAGAPLEPQSQELVRGQRFLIGNTLGFVVFAVAGHGGLWLVLWLLPMASWLPLISRVRNIAEHALVGQGQADPLRQARTTRAGWPARALLAPYWVNFHSEHHLFTQLPCWQLPRAHALLQRQGTTARMEIEPGYAAVLQRATSAPAR